MRFVIDMQGAQSTGSLNRGIGRYTLSLALAIVRNRGDHEVILALSGLFPEAIEPIRVAFYGLLPQENIRVWVSPNPVCHRSSQDDWRRHSAELVREAFLASLKPDIVLVSSLFEGLGDDAVTSIGRLSCTVPTAAILYDLIPLIYRKPYLENPKVDAWYENKLDHLRRADLLLAISESSRQDGVRYLGFPAEVCVNISTSADPQFQPQQIDSERERDIRQHYGLQRQFVMYTGGIDHRKNIEGLVRAYARLPEPLRASHQLAIVCSIQPPSRMKLERLAKEQGLMADELVLTGFVPDEDLPTLYSLCKAFVFPSLYEGFGLPALEAMCCGRAVISANNSSLPEVIGRSDAMFDARNDASISEKLEQVLTDDTFRSELERHGLEQAKLFSWETSAQRAIAAAEALHTNNSCQSLACAMPARRPKLAFVSPLPPERSGISDYSAELLPELSRHYDIDVIVAQDSISDPWVRANCPIRSAAWFRAHKDRYDRALYHFGNNHLHQHMFDLLDEVPGVIVLHDFFLSGIAAVMDITGQRPDVLAQGLFQGHGYAAVQQLFHATETKEVVWRYPCNLGVIQKALGVIVHSENSRRLATQWISKDAADEWAVIPLLRIPAIDIEKTDARRLLKLGSDDFVVCSFGLLGPTKLNHLLLDAWMTSDLAKDTNCVLVFVGENEEGKYGADLLAAIRRSGFGERIRITGWTDNATFHHYLAAADIAVQLRTLSRGETSAAVLDCMNYGLPTIVNANGSMADLPDNGVWRLPDEFVDAELVGALNILWRDSSRRQLIGAKAREIIHVRHAPRTCSEQYAKVIETSYRVAHTNVDALCIAVTEMETAPAKSEQWASLAAAIALSIPPRPAPRQLLVNISELVQQDLKSGVQRVVRSILHELLIHPPEGFKVEPVYATSSHGYRYARNFTLHFLNCSGPALADDPIEYQTGDVFLGLDLDLNGVPLQLDFYRQLRNYGIRVQFVVYDLLPITLPKAFPQGMLEKHKAWLDVVAESDGAICISRNVAKELASLLETNKGTHRRPYRISWFHLGAAIETSYSTKKLPDDAGTVLTALGRHPGFLMVGTLEPRKGHAQTIAAFELLWGQGIDVNLVIVGKQGWQVDRLADKLRRHPELNNRLFWLDGISDEYLERIYDASTCLLAASEGEGFGLPLIESAQHNKSIIARDIPVFHEVAGEHAYYFSGLAPEDLARAISDWLALYNAGEAPSSSGMPWLTWAESGKQLMQALLEEDDV
jgi:glycosyltransferase involved in cell wall biosynthesis